MSLYHMMSALDTLAWKGRFFRWLRCRIHGRHYYSTVIMYIDLVAIKGFSRLERKVKDQVICRQMVTHGIQSMPDDIRAYISVVGQAKRQRGAKLATLV